MELKYDFFSIEYKVIKLNYKISKKIVEVQKNKKRYKIMYFVVITKRVELQARYMQNCH